MAVIEVLRRVDVFSGLLRVLLVGVIGAVNYLVTVAPNGNGVALDRVAYNDGLISAATVLLLD